MVILNRKYSFKRGFKASRYKKSNENQIQFDEITQYTFGSLKFPHKQPFHDRLAPNQMLKYSLAMHPPDFYRRVPVPPLKPPLNYSNSHPILCDSINQPFS